MPFLTQGKTNWKYIIIVLILAVVVGGGILYCRLKFPTARFPPIKLPPKEVTVATDKTEYNYVDEPEGMMRLTVKNNLDKSICFESCNTYYLLKKKNEGWEEIDTILCEFITITECIQPGKTKIFEDIRTWKEKGTYKFAAPVCIDCEDLKDLSFRYDKTIYSNEFTIKEKVAETADWKTYRNEEYGFEFKYPDHAKEYELIGTRGKPIFYPLSGLDIPFTGATLSLTVGLSDLTDCFYSSLGQSIKKEKITINNKEFCLNVDLDSGPSTKHKRYSYSVETNIEDSYIVFEFIAEFNPYCGVYPEYKCEKFNEEEAINTFNRILSTFRFLE